MPDRTVLAIAERVFSGGSATRRVRGTPTGAHRAGDVRRGRGLGRRGLPVRPLPDRTGSGDPVRSIRATLPLPSRDTGRSERRPLRPSVLNRVYLVDPPGTDPYTSSTTILMVRPKSSTARCPSKA